MVEVENAIEFFRRESIVRFIIINASTYGINIYDSIIAK